MAGIVFEQAHRVSTEHGGGTNDLGKEIGQERKKGRFQTLVEPLSCVGEIGQPVP